MSETKTVESPHLTVAQLADRWHTTPQAIYTARHRGKAPKGFKRGVKLLFPISQVEEFEAHGIAADRPSNRGTDPAHRPAEVSRPHRARVPAQRTVENPAA